MFQQELVIDHSVFSAIANPESLYNLRIYSDNLLNKIFVVDRNKNKDSFLCNKYQEIFNSLSYDSKCKVKNALFKHFQPDKIKAVNCNTSKDVFAEVVTKTKSKIGNSENQNHKLLNLKNCEILNIEEFCSPPNTCKVINYPRVINLCKNDKFKIYDILKDYFISAEKIVIQDRYLLSHKSFIQFKLIIGQCRSLKSITVYTSALSFEKAHLRLRESFPNISIDLFLVGSEYHDRKMILDQDIVMEFSSGFDFIDSSFQVWRNEVKISIDRYKK